MSKSEREVFLESELSKCHQILEEIKSKVETGNMLEIEYGHISKKRDYSRVPSIHTALESFRALEDNFIGVMESFTPFLESAMAIEDTAHIETKPSWNNPWFPFIDAISTYGLISFFKPRRYVEVGSGFSTKFARQAITDFSPETQLISIDPFPRAEIDSICDRTIRTKLEDVDPSFFDTLSSDDIFFLDSSHRADQGSDVAVFFCEILPSFPKGMLYGIHDIFFPDEDYPTSWLHRHFSEQYLLGAYFFGGAGGDEVILPCYYVSKRPHLYSPIKPLLESENVIRSTSVVLGQSFWLRKN